MNRILKCMVLVLILGIGRESHAQNFSGYVAIGTNVMSDKLTSSGESQVGSRIGLNVGPGVLAKLSEKLGVAMELLYSQNAIYVNPLQFPDEPLDRIRLHYLEVPLVLNYYLKTKRETEYHTKKSLSAGVSFARLFHYNFRSVNKEDITDVVSISEPNGLLLTLGATAPLAKSFAFNGRASVSSFGEWTYTFRAIYILKS